MATSGLVSRIHSCDLSKPENTRFQYGSSVLPLSSAAPMAGTCDEPIPAMILATVSLPFLRFGFGFAGLGFRLGLGFSDLCLRLAGGLSRRLRLKIFGRPVLAGARAIAFDRTAALKHHVGIVRLRRAGHDGRQMLERMAVGGAELRGEIDVAAKFQHPVVVALKHGIGLL